MLSAHTIHMSISRFNYTSIDVPFPFMVIATFFRYFFFFFFLFSSRLSPSTNRHQRYSMERQHNFLFRHFIEFGDETSSKNEMKTEKENKKGVSGGCDWVNCDFQQNWFVLLGIYNRISWCVCNCILNEILLLLLVGLTDLVFIEINEIVTS